MIILKQKEYTKEDKKAFEELKNATNNFTDLPKGRGGMKARDVFRIHDTTTKLGKLMDQNSGQNYEPLTDFIHQSLGGERSNYKNTKLSDINWKDTETALKNIGLPELGKGAQHLVHKYTDPELRLRWLRRYRPNEYSKQKDNFDYNSHISSNNIDLALQRNKKIEEINKSKSPKLIKSIQRTRERYKTLTNQDLDFSNLSPDDRSGFNGPDELDPIYGLRKEISKNIKHRKSVASEDTKEMLKKSYGGKSRKLIKQVIKHKLPLIGLGNAANTSFKGGRTLGLEISDPKIKNEVVHAHEWGHSRFNKRIRDLSGKLNMGVNSLYKLGNENGASSEALAKLKHAGVPESQLAEQRKDLEAAYKTYAGDAGNKVLDYLNNYYPTKSLNDTIRENLKAKRLRENNNKLPKRLEPYLKKT